jgi:hypothetical protein
MWTGLDFNGNPDSISMDLKEMYDDVYPIVKQVPETQHKDSKMITKFERMEHNLKYTLPFKLENVDKLWNMRNGKVAFTIKDDLQGDMPPAVFFMN